MHVRGAPLAHDVDLGALAATTAWELAVDALYRHLWTTPLTLSRCEKSLDLNSSHRINTGLMAIFFFVFVAGLETRRALVAGEPRHRRRPALPVCGTLSLS